MEQACATAVRLCECGCGQPTKLAPQTRTVDGAVRGQPLRFLFGHQPKGGSGPMNGRWNGGRRICHGYVEILMPDHPRAKRGYVFEHIVVAESALGRPLARQHPVHHVDQDRTNNANTNLVICQDHAYHGLLHQRQRALDACGDPNALPCSYCQSYERQDEITARKNSGGGRQGQHRSCHAAAQKARQARRKTSATLPLQADEWTTINPPPTLDSDALQEIAAAKEAQ